MSTLGPRTCNDAPVAARVSPDDLLVLLEVGRTGSFARAADARGVNHTTIARRVAALERALGGKVLSRTSSGWELTPLGMQAVDAAEKVWDAVRGLAADGRDAEIEDIVRLTTPDAFAIYVAAPAAARVRHRHPGVTVEIIASTRRAGTQRSGSDVEVVVGKPDVLRAEARRLAGYGLGLFGSTTYFKNHPKPLTLDDLANDHRLVYFISSMLQIDALDVGRRLLPDMHDAVTSTNVIAHVAATRAGAGVGLLPTFIAGQHQDLVRVLPDAVEIKLDYWVVSRIEGMRRPAVAALLEEIQATVARMSDAHGRLR